MDGRFVDVTDVDQLWERPLRDAPIDAAWGLSTHVEPRMHRIHGYPAKFPAFLTLRGLDYAKEHRVRVRQVGDIFCGCGTVAHEARRFGLGFWGCDINPVATLIARVKSSRISPRIFARQVCAVADGFARASTDVALADSARARLEHWFRPEHFGDLARLLNSIRTVSPVTSPYQDALLCAFSAILKSCSQWRRRAIKPTYDPGKSPADVLDSFLEQAEFMRIALEEQGRVWEDGNSHIHRANALTVSPPRRKLDMLITSPPYVTSYEYADLHQLSSLWLGYTDDHRRLREGSIGSTQHEFRLSRGVSELNQTATRVVFSVYEHDRRAAQSIANYFVDMQRVVARTRPFLAPGGLAMFVIGNTQYGDVEIDNAAHLTEALLRSGYSRVRAVRRHISNKAATPFRNAAGRFSDKRSDKTIYAHEYVLMAHP